MVDDLDRLFDEGLPKGKKALSFLKESYDCGAQILVNRTITDKLIDKSGLSFHIGTDDPTMRRIASWLLTNYSDRCDDLIRRLWKRCGREDVKLIGLLLANIEGDAWEKMLSMVDKSLPLDLTLEMAEEIKRSGRSIPSAEFLSKWNQSKIQKQNAMLIASLDMREEFVQLVSNAPLGGELFERIRKRSLEE
ncbi:MAG: hypothetical protein DWC02_00205 [Candidatus Poseidoniales archaeon]|nr:MAG: hypothetical protein DWC02_00205 [Candidatus Poseidoniales archaeon]